MNAQHSQIIFLHGASSSGKSTLARALQAVLPTPFWHISIDHLRDSGVLPMQRVHRGDFAWTDMRDRFFTGYHASLGAYADAGNDLIIEHILEGNWQAELGNLLARHRILFVGLHCPLDELRRREALRGDRPVGSAEADFRTIHNGRRYDLDLKVGDGMEANVETIIATRERPPERSAFFTP